MPPKKGASPRKTTSPAGAGSSAPLLPGGDSSSWAAAKENQIRIVELFLSHAQTDAALKEQAGLVWASIPEEVVCSQSFFQHYATFLASTYSIPKGVRNAGKKLKLKTALGLWSGLINQLQTMHGASELRPTQVRRLPSVPAACREVQTVRAPAQLPLPLALAV
jgi:hypothetical protein